MTLILNQDIFRGGKKLPEMITSHVADLWPLSCVKKECICNHVSFSSMNY